MYGDIKVDKRKTFNLMLLFYVSHSALLFFHPQESCSKRLGAFGKGKSRTDSIDFPFNFISTDGLKNRSCVKSCFVVAINESKDHNQ